MTAEIERKFLVVNDSWQDHASKGAAFCQGYLLVRKNRFVRVRIIDNARGVLTIKLRTGRLRREEFEYEIPYADALEMIAYATSVVDKTRYEVNHRGCLWEVDVYGGVHDGLVVAEIELADESDQPPCPPWLGPEVTGNAAFSTRTLAMLVQRNDYRSRNVSRLQPDGQPSQRREQ
ncbi:CYTH domain-containing protein [Rhizobium ruizarguesonis]|uniref:CYTH domain-containing protein n=1 Tax=Rhizobium ruizarguesonis TaxID=2081791 RepID=UPI001031679F|nr:CYTH domain-containing protein [Rhizobium ruizarguesonis]TAY74754.1 CYTH domain-containing protein [Rhizobium ruizarguesonis]